jgi:hypothetical protein
MKTGIPSKNLSIPSFTDLPMAVFSIAPEALVVRDWIRAMLILFDSAVTLSSIPGLKYWAEIKYASKLTKGIKSPVQAGIRWATLNQVP